MGARSQYVDEPKTLRDDAFKQERRSFLAQVHVAPLTKFVDELRDKRSEELASDFERCHIPYFDPLDGGVDARCLFLFEAPGGKAVKSGFISRNNPDETARIFFELNECAGLNRCLTAAWNIVPWYLGSNGRIRAANSTDIRQGVECLSDLLGLFRRLEIVVLSGRKAQKAARDLKESGFAHRVELLEMWHPSPQSLNRVPSRKQDIYEVLRKIAERLS